MKNKLFYGLFGCSSDGKLYSPSGKFLIKLPPTLAFKLHTFINENLCYVGLENTKYLWNKVK
jgi:hypothetical protein